MQSPEIHRKYLIRCLEDPLPNPQGRPLVQAFLRLLTQMEEDKPLDKRDFSYVENKVKKVFCYTEKFGGVFNFLENYHFSRK